MKLSRLTQRGHAHLILPVLAIVAVAGIGTLLLGVNHAQTLSCVQMPGTFQQVVNATPPYNKDGRSTGYGTTHCVQYIQQMINGSIAYMVVKGVPGSNIAASSTTSINQAPLSDLGNLTFDVESGFGSVTHVYNGTDITTFGTTTGDIGFLQAVMNKYFNNKTYEPKGALPVNGKTDAATWYALCAYTSNTLATSRTQSSDYTSSGSKTNMWYLRSYMRAGYSASSDAGCKALLNPPKTTTPPTTNSAWKLDASVSKVATSSVASTQDKYGDLKFSFTGSMANQGPATSIKANTIHYKMYYFEYAIPNSANYPTPGANGAGYVGKIQIGSTVAYSKALTGSLQVTSPIVTIAKPAPATIATVYICGTLNYTGSNTSVAPDQWTPVMPGSSQSVDGSPSCALLQSPAGTVGTGGGGTTSQWALSGTTTGVVKDLEATFTNTIKNAGPGLASGFSYGTYSFRTATIHPETVAGSGGMYPGEAAVKLQAYTGSLAKGDSSAPILLSIPIPKVTEDNESFICSAIAFKPAASSGNTMSSSMPVCEPY